MYLTFEVNTLKVKSSRRIEMNYENKKARAVGLAESIMNQCVILYNNLRSVVKVDKMCRLHDNFLFILGMLNSLGSQCDVMPLTIYRASFAYYPLLVDMHKDEALNIIYDMFKVTERIKFSLRWTQDIPLLNRSSRLLFTLSTYLCALTSTNPEFFEKHRKPMNMWKINDHHH